MVATSTGIEATEHQAILNAGQMGESVPAQGQVTQTEEANNGQGGRESRQPTMWFRIRRRCSRILGFFHIGSEFLRVNESRRRQPRT